MAQTIRKILHFLLLLLAFSSLFAQEKCELKVPKLQDGFVLPAHTATRVGCRKWLIKEACVDSARMDNDTLQLFINRGNARPFKPRTVIESDVCGWEMSIQKIHAGHKLIVPSRFVTSVCEKVILQFDWEMDVFKREKNGTFLFVTQQHKYSTLEELVKKGYEVQVE